MSLHVAHTSQSAAPPHVDDGDLLRFQDGELHSHDRARVTLHLASCAQCDDRRAVLAAVAARVHAANQAVVLPAALATPPWYGTSGERQPRRAMKPSRWPTTSRGRRAAGAMIKAVAAVAVLAAAAAAATPVGHWLAGRFHSSASMPTLASGRAERPATITGVDPLASRRADVSFVPTSRTLTISLDGRSGDSIEVRATSAEAVRVRSRATTGEPTVAVMPNRLQLVSPREGTTAYAVEVPPNVRVVEVRGGARVLVRLTRSALDTGNIWRGLVP